MGGAMTTSLERVIEAIQIGGRVVFKNTDDRELPAEWLGNLLGGRIPNVEVHPRGLSVENARIVGLVDWSHDRFCRFEFTQCEFEEDIIANNLRVCGEVRFTKSQFPSLNMVDALVEGDLHLDELHVGKSGADANERQRTINLGSINVTGTIHFSRSMIHGGVLIYGAVVGQGILLPHVEIDCPQSEWALDASAIKCGQDVFLTGAKISGGVTFKDASISSTLSCSGATINNMSGWALNAYGAEIGGSAIFSSIDETPFSAFGAISFSAASVGSLSFTGAQLTYEKGWALDAQGMKCNRDADLVRATINGGVSFMDALIRGNLLFNDSKLSSNSEHKEAANLHRISVETSVFFKRSLITGSVDLIASKIGSELSCSEATINNMSGWALNAYGAEIGGSAIFSSIDETPFSAFGAISFSAASVGSLSFTGAQLTYEKGWALYASAVDVKDSVDLSRSQVFGAISLAAAHIGGSLLCGEAVFNNPKGDALYAHQLKLTGNAEFGNGFKSFGRINFLESSASGLDFTKAELAFEAGAAFIGSRMKISGRVVLDELKVAGRITIIGASIGQLSMQGVRFGLGDAHLSSDDVSDCATSTAAVDHKDVVFLLELTRVHGNVRVDEGAHFSGDTVWQGTQIGGDLQINGARFLGGRGAFFANQLKVGGKFTFKNIQFGEGAKISLRMANVMELDDLPNSYPSTTNTITSRPGSGVVVGSLDISGFVYSQFTDTSINPASDERGRAIEWNHDERLKWVARQTHQRNHDDSTEGQYSPQPYLQLAEVYRQMGKDHERRKVLKRQQQDLRKWGELSRPSKWWSRIVDLLTGYGYESWRALVAIFLIYLLSVSLTTVVRDHGGFVATGNTASFVVAKHGAQSVQATSCTPYYPCNSSWLFPVDAAIPVINLHQSEFWSFNSSNSWGDYGELLFSLFSLLGWGFTSLLVAASAGLIKQN
jgi:hypothetical protein